jgi:hypothetical protein
MYVPSGVLPMVCEHGEYITKNLFILVATNRSWIVFCMEYRHNDYYIFSVYMCDRSINFASLSMIFLFHFGTSLEQFTKTTTALATVHKNYHSVRTVHKNYHSIRTVHKNYHSVRTVHKNYHSISRFCELF